MPLLIETFCSKASTFAWKCFRYPAHAYHILNLLSTSLLPLGLKQRRGRAGRVRPGNCYKLLSNKTFSKLRSDTEPEIMRSALDQTLLSLLFLGIDCSPNGPFISSLLDPPTNESLQSAIESLETLGAVNDTKNGLTPLGMHLAGIPAPPVVGKSMFIKFTRSIIYGQNMSVSLFFFCSFNSFDFGFHFGMPRCWIGHGSIHECRS